MRRAQESLAGLLLVVLASCADKGGPGESGRGEAETRTADQHSADGNAEIRTLQEDVRGDPQGRTDVAEVWPDAPHPLDVHDSSDGPLPDTNEAPKPKDSPEATDLPGPDLNVQTDNGGNADVAGEADSPCVPYCDGKQCGPDGCGGECGTCVGTQDECVAGACLCQPVCEGKECGPDGCGGECGTCVYAGPEEAQCMGGQCVEFKCAFEFLPGAPCDDGNPCTSDGTCLESTCTEGNPLDCDDGNDCTEDGCDVNSGCTHQALADGLLCGEGEQWACLQGQCVCAPVCMSQGCQADGCGGACGPCPATASCGPECPIPCVLAATSLGGDASELPVALLLDGADNRYLVGNFSGGAANFGGEALPNAGGSDIFVAKFDPQGNHSWSKRFGGPGDDSVQAAALGGGGQLLLAGYFGSEAIDFGGAPLPNAGPPVELDIFLVSLGPDGNHVWSLNTGGAGSQQANAITVDAEDRIYLAGTFNGPFASLGGEPLTSAEGNDCSVQWVNDGFAARFSASGEHEWSVGFGSTGPDVPFAIVAQGAGSSLAFGTQHCYITGYCKPPNCYDYYWPFAVMIDSDGSVRWTRAYLNSGRAMSAAVGQWDEAYVAGSFHETLSLGGPDLDPQGYGYRGFVARLDPAGEHVWSKSFGDGSAFHMDSLFLNPSKSSLYVTGSFGGDFIDFGDGPLPNYAPTCACWFDCWCPEDYFVAKFDAAGNPFWSMVIGGGNDDDEGVFGAATSSGHLVLAGALVSPELLLGDYPVQSVGAGSDVFMIEIGENLDGQCGTCVPWCEGLTCGSDGCGGSCGQCAAGEVCREWQCCKPSCQDKECGSDGCGGECGECSEAAVCNAGKCCQPDCGPGDCKMDDGCGGSCTCPPGHGCLDGQCVFPDIGWLKTAAADSGDSAAVIFLDVTADGPWVAGIYYPSCLFQDFGGNLLQAPPCDVVTDAILIQRLGLDGSHLWSKIFQGADVSAAALAPGGQIVLAGDFGQPGISFGGAPLPGSMPDVWTETDIFLAKLDSEGDHVWSKAIGSESWDEALALCSDAEGALYLAGRFNGDQLNLGDGLPFKPGWGKESFVARYAPDGALSWGTVFLGEDINPNSLAADGSGNVYVAGEYHGGKADFGNGGILQPASGWKYDREGFIAKLGPDGKHIWSLGVGGDYQKQELVAVTLGKDGRLYLGGIADPGDVDILGHKLALECQCSSKRAFIVALSTDGEYLWSLAPVPCGPSDLSDLTVDLAGDLYLVGSRSKNQMAFVGGTPEDNATCFLQPDAYVTKITSAGQILWSFPSSGAGKDEATAVAVDALGNVYTAGTFDGCPVTAADGPLPPAGADSGMFLLKLTP